MPGLGVTLMGVAGTTLWRSEALDVVGPGETMTVGPYTLALRRRDAGAGSQLSAPTARHIALMDGEPRRDDAACPSSASIPAEGQDTNDTAIRTTGLRDLYLALGDDRGGGRWTVRAYVSPLAPFIWLGALVMALGGMLSLWGRLRVHEPRAPPRRPCSRRE